jgi:hypothetical protein
MLLKYLYLRRCEQPTQHKAKKIVGIKKKNHCTYITENYLGLVFLLENLTDYKCYKYILFWKHFIQNNFNQKDSRFIRSLTRVNSR